MLQDQIETCTENYKKWKEIALFSNDIFEARKAITKSLFWAEMQSAFIMLFALEQARGKDPRMKKKLIVAKANLSKKLADYAENILNEMKLSSR